MEKFLPALWAVLSFLLDPLRDLARLPGFLLRSGVNFVHAVITAGNKAGFGKNKEDKGAFFDQAATTLKKTLLFLWFCLWAFIKFVYAAAVFPSPAPTSARQFMQGLGTVLILFSPAAALFGLWIDWSNDFSRRGGEAAALSIVYLAALACLCAGAAVRIALRCLPAREEKRK